MGRGGERGKRNIYNKIYTYVFFSKVAKSGPLYALPLFRTPPHFVDKALVEFVFETGDSTA